MTLQIGCPWHHGNMVGRQKAGEVLYEDTGDIRYRDAAYAANRYVRRTLRVDGPPETRGAVKGSFPVDGGYSITLM